MFTGIIIEMGQVVRMVQGSQSFRISIKGEKCVGKAVIGSSIAVNGVCLTVTGINRDIFEADVMPETVRRSNLLGLKTGDRVNLEPALRLGDEMGGHMVTGHIDGVGTITSLAGEDNAIWMTVEAAESILGQVVEKGSVALDGVSLTVAKVDRTSFSVSLIPFTAQETLMGKKRAGAQVNIETDIIGKYVEKYTAAYSGKSAKKLTPELLKQYGFF